MDDERLNEIEAQESLPVMARDPGPIFHPRRVHQIHTLAVGEDAEEVKSRFLAAGWELEPRWWGDVLEFSRPNPGWVPGTERREGSER